MTEHVRDHRLVLRPRLYVTTLALGVLAASSLWMIFGGGAASSESTGYVFDNVRVLGQDLENVSVLYNYSWGSPDFPGTRRCEWVALDSSGNQIGHKTIDLTGLQPAYYDHLVEIPLEAAGIADRAQVTCESERLDDASGTYRFENVGVGPDAAFGQDRRSLRLVGRPSWTGTGAPGTAECSVSIRDRSGREMFSHHFTFAGGTSGEASDIRLIAPSPMQAAPRSAELACTPFDG